MIRNLFKFDQKQKKFIWTYILIFLVAIFLRVYKLAEVPRTMHRDEAWFFYNAFLLNENGTNIYGEKWPLTVDFWGEQVSASHSYYGSLFLHFFGHSQFAFRLTTVTFSLLTLLLFSQWLYRLTNNKKIVLLASSLYAISPWNIIMTRASSTMLIDLFTMLLFAYFYYEGLRWFFRHQSWTNKSKLALCLWLLGTYALLILCYLTYYSARLLVFPLGIIIFIYVFYTHKDKQTLKQVWWLTLPLLIYLLMPFLYFFNTAYARGRYDETTAINSGLSQVILSHGINYAGQAHMPIWLTRIFFNKISVNAYLLAQQFLTFFSPSVILFHSSPPARYFTPYIGAITWLEYLGLLFFLGVLFFVAKFKIKINLPLLLLLLLALSSVPAFLTIDDFPNFQRGVMMTPFWQMASAYGLYYFSQNFKNKKIIRNFLSLAFLSIFIPFFFFYYYLSPHGEQTFRNAAEKEVAEWINAFAHDSKIVIEDTEFLYFYPLLLKKENIFSYPIIRYDQTPQFIISQAFMIGNRLFIKNLAQFFPFAQFSFDPQLNFQPEYIITKIFENNNLYQIPYNYRLLKNIYYDEHILAYQIYFYDPSATAEADLLLE